MNRLSTRGVFVASLLLLASSAGMAQDATGKIAGVITDQTGAVVAGAHVSVINTQTKVTKETNSDKQGYFQVLQLPIGKYEVDAESAGFSKAVARPKEPLDINQTLRVDITLQLGATSSEVTIESQGSVVETENSTTGGTVSGHAVFELPLNGRNTLDLLATQPGVTATNPDSGAAGGYSIGGGRTDSVTYLLDGGNNNNLLSNAAVVTPNPDAVAEFRVLESTYGAEYGRNAGGIVSIVTKSGTNSLHGTAYDYIRNDALDANSFFNNENGISRDVLKRNQFGFTVGGPILIPKLFDGRNKLFFFFSYEGQRQSDAQEEGKVATFTPAEANGDFSQAVNGGPDPNVAAFLTANPYYQSNPTLAAQAIIDPTKIDPGASAYFKNNLIPTSPTGFLFPVGSATDNNNQYLGKIDYNIGSRDILTGTFTARDEPQIVPFSEANVTGYPISRDTTSYFGNVTYTHTFTPSLINEFRVTAQRNNRLNAVPTVKLPGPQALGINITPDVTTGPPLLGFFGSGLNTGFSPNGPTNLVDNTYAYYDNLSWVKGKHTMKYGFYFSPYQDNTSYGYYLTGEYFFYGPGTFTGSGTDFADFLMGLPDELFQAPNAPSNIRSDSYAGYGQDTWKVTRRLTLTLGLRYEYNSPKRDTHGRSFSVIPGLQSTRFPNAPEGLVFPGDAGAPTGANFPDKNDWAPRFGFAWDVFGHAKTSLRGGFGVFYDILKGEDNLQFNGQTPFFSSADVYFNAPVNGSPNSGYTSNPGFFTQPYSTNYYGTPNPFPSHPPSQDVNFAASGFLPVGGANPFFVDPHLRTPYTYQYNLSLQQEVAQNMVATVAYVGYSSHKLTGLVDVNPFTLGTDVRILNPNDQTTNFSYLSEFKNVTHANYNALQASLEKRFGDVKYFGKTFFTLAYTWSHEIDNVSGFRQRSYSVPYYNPNEFRASGDTDLRQTFTLSGGWELPLDKAWTSGPKLLTKGWSVYPIVTYHTGFALDVYAGLSTSAGNPGPSGAGDAGSVRADIIAPVSYYNPQSYQTINGTNAGGNQSGNYYFNPNSFSIARILQLNDLAQSNPSQLVGQFTYGTLPRNSLRGPGLINTDLAIAKHFYFGEKLDVELRADMFNVFNHTEFGNPDTSITDATFGQISTTSAPRIIQVALHLVF